jgi:hypothetical protein
VISVLILLAVFCPIFASHIVDEAFALAVFLVFVLWLVVFVVRSCRNLAAAWSARHRAAGAAEPAEEPPTPEEAQPVEVVGDPRETGFDLAEPSAEVSASVKEEEPIEKGIELDQHEAESPPSDSASEGDQSSDHDGKQGGPAHD